MLKEPLGINGLMTEKNCARRESNPEFPEEQQHCRHARHNDTHERVIDTRVLFSLTRAKTVHVFVLDKPFYTRACVNTNQFLLLQSILITRWYIHI